MTNLDRYLQNLHYKAPSELRLLLGKYKIQNRLNNIYFSSDKFKDDNDKSLKVNLFQEEKSQLITGCEKLDLETKIRISFYTIRTLNFYKKINKVLILSAKENIEKWYFLLESLLRDLQEDVVKKEKERKKTKTNELVSRLKTKKDIETFINSHDENRYIAIVQDSLFLSLFEDNINQECDLLILENFDKHTQYKKKKDEHKIFEDILSKFKCYLTFSDKYEELKKSLSVISNHSFIKNKINYFILISHSFTTRKIYVENAVKNSDELMSFCKDFLETNYKGIFKVDIDKNQKSAEIILSAEKVNSIRKEINDLAKDNNFYQFFIHEKNLCYFSPFQLSSEKSSLIDLNHPLLEWIKNSPYFSKESYPLSVCTLKYDSDLTGLNNDLKQKIKQGLYFYLIGYCQYENLYNDNILIYQIKNIGETTSENFTCQESEIFINYAFYHIGEPLANAENRDESKLEIIEKEKDYLANMIFKEWESREKFLNPHNHSKLQYLSQEGEKRQKGNKTGIIEDYKEKKQSLDREKQQTQKPEFIAFGLIVVE